MALMLPILHWDREGKADEDSSCWIRVAQVWAGKKWGAMYIPRIGQEVIVDFLEGDPDKPIVTGRVYNGENRPPYDLPANKTVSTIKSNSSKGGEGFNELRFEDKKGAEQVFLHAEKNLDVQIKNDKAENIGKTLLLTVGADVTEVFKANQSTEISQDLLVKATNILLEASTNITFKVGQSSIVIENGGITISTPAKIAVEGAMVDVKASGVATIQGGVVKIN